MIIEKSINWDGYTKAEIKKVYPDMIYLCDLSNEDGKSDVNISFDPLEFMPFEPLTDEEIDIVNDVAPNSDNVESSN